MSKKQKRQEPLMVSANKVIELYKRIRQLEADSKRIFANIQELEIEASHEEAQTMRNLNRAQKCWFGRSALHYHWLHREHQATHTWLQDRLSKARANHKECVEELMKATQQWDKLLTSK